MPVGLTDSRQPRIDTRHAKFTPVKGFFRGTALACSVVRGPRHKLREERRDSQEIGKIHAEGSQ